MASSGILITLLFIGYALFAKWMARSSITGPIVFTVAGLVLAADLFSTGTSPFSFSVALGSDTVQIILEVTLVIILFSDAVMIDTRAARREAFLPGRLLGIGLPLTIVAGTLLALVVFPGITFWPAAVLAIILAPTDAALGQAVVSNPDVPAMVRQGLGIESGLNDGIAVPLLAVAVAAAASEMQNAAEIATVFAREIGMAIVVGMAIGWIGAKVVDLAARRSWTGREGMQLAVPLLAILCYFGAVEVGGSGFIAAFIGGLTFGYLMRAKHPRICEFSETVGHLLTMVAFFIFGSLILAPSLEFITARMVVYAVLSLTVVRLLPVAIALIGTNLRLNTQLFVGWFGPRGLASLVFIGTVVVEASPEDGQVIIAAGAVTVGLSVLLHGLTAWPASVRYATWYRRMAGQPDAEHMAESQAVTVRPPSRLMRRVPPHPPEADVPPQTPR